jgi:hypothetical protein
MDLWEMLDSGGSLDQMSVPGAHCYQFYPGDGTRQTTQGFEALFHCLLKDCVVDQSCMRFNKAVKSVCWVRGGVKQNPDCGDVTCCVHEGDDGRKTEVGINNNVLVTDTKGENIRNPSTSSSVVTIECEDGDVFYADHVIVTSSVGFLRENMHTFFQPPLPQEHEEAVRNMGWGDVSKLFLIWEEEQLSGWRPGATWRERVFGADVEGLIPLWVDGSTPLTIKSGVTDKVMDVRA